jgi:hypothetical protein
MRLVEAMDLPAGEDAALDQHGNVVDLIEILGDPVHCLEVAQAAFAVLDVGLKDIAAVPKALVPAGALGQLGLDELDAGARLQALLEALFQIDEKRLVTPQEPRLQKRRADRDIVFGQAQAFVDRTGRVADLEAEVPQRVEDRLDDLLAVRRHLVGQQE